MLENLRVLPNGQDKTGVLVSRYLKRLTETFKNPATEACLPSFFVSGEYFVLSECEWTDNWWKCLGPEDGDGGWLMIPVMDGQSGLPPGETIQQIFGKPIMCSPFATESPTLPENALFTSKVFDRNYIYDPAQFISLEGKDKLILRKAWNYWNGRASKQYPLEYFPCPPWGKDPKFDAQIEQLVYHWAEGIKDDIHDVDTLVRFAFMGKLREALKWKGKLIGLNVWDLNWFWRNYRLCITKSGEKRLQTFTRLLFYRSRCMEKLPLVSPYINDGGDLDKASLATYKKRLHPVGILNTFSYQPIKGEK